MKIWHLCAGVFLIVPTLAGALQPKERSADLDLKEFFLPELYISTSTLSFQEAAGRLKNAGAWDRFFEENGADFHVYFDPRSWTPVNIMGAIPLIPGSGKGNHISLAGVSSALGRQVNDINAEVVGQLFGRWVRANRDVLRIDAAQLASARATQVTPVLWHLDIPQVVNGVPVRHARLLASVNHGNMVMVGAASWGNVRINTAPRITAQRAREIGFDYAGGMSANDILLKEPALEIIPYASVEAGYGHRLAWVFLFQRQPGSARWEVMVDAHAGDVIAFQDINHYVDAKISGGTYPLTCTEICPDIIRCGTMNSDQPMPFTNTGMPAPNNFTNSAGHFDFTGGTAATSLSGKYVDITDTCGPIGATGTPDIDLGGVNGDHDCTLPPGGASSAARTAMYELNKIFEEARGFLPFNSWLQGISSALDSNMNIVDACNAFFDGTVNFYRSGGGCRNTGEIAAILDHEWGHGMDAFDGSGLSNSSEGYADIASMYRLWASCVGYGMLENSGSGACGATADGSGDNNQEAQTGPSHCDTDCSGVRDSDWAKHADGLPDTPAFTCASCVAGPGPCGRQVHCAATPVRQAAWDFVARDLRGAPYNYDANTAFIIGDKIFYQGSGNVGSWHTCTCPSTSDGCAADNGYPNWLAADDDNGDLNDGTPHMTALFNAYNRHGIACAVPAVQDSGCAGGPVTAPALTASAGNNQVNLSWTPAAGATRYNVYRSEGYAGCDFGKALIGSTIGNVFSDSEAGNGRTYSYVVMAEGADNTCFSPASTCVQATPQPCCAANLEFSSSAIADNCAGGGSGDGDGTLDPGETAVVQATTANTGQTDATGVTAVLHTETPGVTITDNAATFPDIAAGNSATSDPPHFTISVSDSVPCATAIGFTIDYASNEGFWSDQFTLVVGQPTTAFNLYNSTDVPKSILDLQTAFSVVSVLDTDPIVLAAATINIAHTSDDNLDIALVAPGGSTFVELSTDNGGSGDHYINTTFVDTAATAITDGTPPFTGSFRPEGSLGTLIGRPANGVWTLVVIDDAPGDTGTLAGWSLILQTQTGFACSACAPCPAITLNPPTLPDGNENQPYNQVITASGGAQPYTFTNGGGLPNGITLAADGTLSGTPTQTGTFNFTVTATDSNGCNGQQAYSLTIDPCPAITLSPSTLPNGQAGAVYNQAISANGGAAPYTFADGGGLPNGITLAAGGTLSGTPTQTGTFNFTVTATDNNGCTGQQAYVLTIDPACLFCDDFEDGVLSGAWTYIKPAWSEGSGVLLATPAGRKAVAVATPAFAGCSACYVESTLRSGGGTGNQLSMLGWYVDKKNMVELMMKQESGKWILKERINGAVAAKGKALLPISPNTVYRARIAFDGAQFQVFIDGTLAITLPASGSHNGTVGFQVKRTTGAFGELIVN